MHFASPPFTPQRDVMDTDPHEGSWLAIVNDSCLIQFECYVRISCIRIYLHIIMWYNNYT